MPFNSPVFQRTVEAVDVGRGNILYQSLTSPITGTDRALTVPANKLWVFNILRVVLITSANVGARNLRLYLFMFSTIPYMIYANYTQTASQTIGYDAALGSAADRSTPIINEVMFPLPLMAMQPGWELHVDTVGALAGDVYDSLRWVVQEYDV